MEEQPLSRAELERKIEVGNAFKRLFAGREQDWKDTIDSFLISLHKEIYEIPAIHLPPAEAHDIILKLQGQSDFIERFKLQMQDWLADAELALDLPPESSQELST